MSAFVVEGNAKFQLDQWRQRIISFLQNINGFYEFYPRSQYSLVPWGMTCTKGIKGN